MVLAFHLLRTKVEDIGSTLDRCTNAFIDNAGLLASQFTAPPCLHLNLTLKDGWVYEVMLLLHDFATAKEIIHKYYEAARVTNPYELLIPIFDPASTESGP